jgi:hypothetical protein
VDPGAGLDAVVSIKIPSLCRDSNTLQTGVTLSENFSKVMQLKWLQREQSSTTKIPIIGGILCSLWSLPRTDHEHSSHSNELRRYMYPSSKLTET